jgi:hypothetical protein
LLRFTRTISVKHHPTGDHYVLSIPRPVAEALNLHEEEGGLVSIEIVHKLHNNKKVALLQAYRDTPIPWREAFNHHVWKDSKASLLKSVPAPPNTLGRSRPTGCGKVVDPRASLRESRLALQYLQAVRKLLKLKMFPRGYKRGPKPRRRW